MNLAAAHRGFDEPAALFPQLVENIKQHRGWALGIGFCVCLRQIPGVYPDLLCLFQTQVVFQSRLKIRHMRCTIEDCNLLFALRHFALQDFHGGRISVVD